MSLFSKTPELNSQRHHDHNWAERAMAIRQDFVVNTVVALFAASSAHAHTDADFRDFRALPEDTTIRPCGLDLDRDGEIGESEDCELICRQSPDALSTSRDDIDNDNGDEHEIYVDCDAPEQRNDCGSSNRPCNSLKTAFSKISDPENKQNIICFRGTCDVHEEAALEQVTQNLADENVDDLSQSDLNELLEVEHNGLASKICNKPDCGGNNRANRQDKSGTTHIKIRSGGIRKCAPGDPQCVAGHQTFHWREPTGNRVRRFQYPSNPLILMGWDADNDGVYPPVDADDSAVITNGGIGHIKNIFDHVSPSASSIEYAHFEVRGFGAGCCSDGNLIWKLGNARNAEHLYFHDIFLNGVNRQNETDGNNMVWSLFKSRQGRWWAFEHIEAQDFGGRMFRGGAEMPGLGGNDSEVFGVAEHISSENAQLRGVTGPVRIANFKATFLPADRTDEGLDCREKNGNCPNTSSVVQASAQFAKIWGNFVGLEIVDNDISARVDTWKPTDHDVGLNRSSFVSLGCSLREIDVIANTVRDFSTPFMLEPDRDGGQATNCGSEKVCKQARTNGCVVDSECIRSDGTMVRIRARARSK